MAGKPTVVQAVYSFKGTNNDELCFKKGDKITITQKEDGGWWEGTLNGKTGWFPSNYVKECKEVAVGSSSTISHQNRVIVLKDLIDSERAHVTELQGLVTNFLQPLEKSGILTSDEYKQLTGNLPEVLDVHEQLLNYLELEETKPHADQKVGKLFLNLAPKIKSVHQTYCSMHPRAVCVLDKYKDELTKHMESCGAASPGVLVLTTNLSKPFRRLDKYSAMLQELERHTEESHVDRGDTQRSVAIYKEIAATCAATRRQKELELQVLTGPVRGWEGQSLTTLGDIIYMGSVAVGPQHHDRYFVLFPTTLLILSVSHRLSAFIYEGKLPLSGINVTRLEDNDQYKNAFELCGPMIEKRIAVCQSSEEANHWVEILKKHMPTDSRTSSFNQKISPVHAQIVPQPPPHMSPMTSAGSVRTSSTRSTTTSSSKWSACSLRPAPPLRPCLALGGVQANASRRPTTYKEDATILDVIEVYCMLGLRNTVNSVHFQLTNERDEDSEKSVADTVQVLLKKVKNLEYNLKTISSQLNEERAARCTLQTIVKNHLLNNSKDDCIEWPAMESNILS